MRHLSLALAVLVIAACGERVDAPSESGSTALVARQDPLEVGATAPAFEGLPEGPAVVVFYRGHW